MSDFEIKGVKQEKDIPSAGGSRIDYSPLFEKYNGISKGSCIHIDTEKKSLAKGIKAAFKKKYGRTVVEVKTRSRKDSDVVDMYIIRKD